MFAFAQFAARWERLAVDLAALTTATQAALRVRQVATPACTG